MSTQTTPVLSALDSVLRQSLAAATQMKTLQNDTLTHLNAALSRIARFYRSTADVVSQSVIEPAAATVNVDGRALRCPRLLVQCTRRDTIAQYPLTFVYTPERVDRITLQIAYENSTYSANDFIQWTSSHSDWCVSGTEVELDGETHAAFLRTALSRTKLFSVSTMTLEPKT